MVLTKSTDKKAQKKKWLRVYRTPSYKKPGRHFSMIKYHKS